MTTDQRSPALASRLGLKAEARACLVRAPAEGGALWISWPKARQFGTDLTLKTVIEIGYRHGLGESKTLGVDAVWSAIKFTRPVPGKTYRNSYGQLPSG